MAKFFKCEHCNNTVGMIFESGVPLICCGEKMKELTKVEGATFEKHEPVVEVEGSLVKVTVSDVMHPMVENHYIEWIFIETKNGGQRKALKPGDKPYAEFNLVNDELIAVYSYCNLHGLWKKAI